MRGVKKALSILSGLIIALAIGASLSILAFLFPFNRLDAIVYDSFMRMRGATPVNPVPVIVEIDEQSLKKYGQWPWPRYALADLVRSILDDGALAVGLDILLAEEDRTSPDYLDRRMRERYGEGLALERLPQGSLNNDLQFRNAIAGKPVVLGAFATFGAGALPPDMPKPTGLAEKTPPGAPQPRETVARTRGLLTPLQEFSDAAPIGIINASVQGDGVVRAVPLLVRAGNNIYAALSVRTLMAALKRDTLRLDSNIEGLACLKIGKLTIPVERDGMFRPVYHGPTRTYPYISAAEVLEGKAAGKFKDRIVFVGSSATGLLDMRATPFDAAMPGVEVHATILDNILSGQYVQVPHWAVGLQIIAVFLTAFLAVAMFGLLPLYGYAPLALAAMSAAFWASWHFFSNGLFISPVYVILAILLAGAIVIPVRFWREQRAKRRIRQAFSRYVSPEVVSRLADDRPLAGEKRDVTILFTDIRGFTSLSADMDPADVVRLLNRYFTPMTACVTEHEGTLDKFVGDALMAFWNAPLEVENHQQKAVMTALDMQAKLAKLRPEFKKDFNNDKLELHMGVGINSGQAHVGNMGSLDLLDYTCIGNEVNLASRLEGMCKQYGVGIVVSASVKDACQGIFFRHLDRVLVKGSDTPLGIFTPVVNVDEKLEKQWQDALSAYFDGKFQAAINMFSALAENGEMAKGARTLVEHCRQLLANPPAHWSGVWKYDTK